MDMVENLKQNGIVPVIKINDAGKAVPLANALIRGGLKVIEITFRTEAAKEAIENVVRECPEMVVGAGTVLTIDNVNSAAQAGAKFIVSPGLNPEVVKAAHDKGMFALPGVITPTELDMGIRLGLDVFKFFPAENFGGINTITALAAPFSGVKFVPTGGISDRNIAPYFNSKVVLAVGGSWMAPHDLIEKNNFDEITRRTQDAVVLYKSGKQM